MKKEIKRYRFYGESKTIIEEIIKDKDRFYNESNQIANKYGFANHAVNHSDMFSGSKLVAFGNPTDKADLALFKKPNKNGIYFPYSKNKEIIEDIKSIKDWTLNQLWDFIGCSPDPFNGNMGIYKDEKLNEMLFFSYNENFKGHKDFIEIKKSEYYRQIGE